MPVWRYGYLLPVPPDGKPGVEEEGHRPESDLQVCRTRVGSDPQEWTVAGFCLSLPQRSGRCYSGRDVSRIMTALSTKQWLRPPGLRATAARPSGQPNTSLAPHATAARPSGQANTSLAPRSPRLRRVLKKIPSLLQPLPRRGRSHAPFNSLSSLEK